jgi:hypothetical protein
MCLLKVPQAAVQVAKQAAARIGRQHRHQHQQYSHSLPHEIACPQGSDIDSSDAQTGARDRRRYPPVSANRGGKVNKIRTTGKIVRL